MTSQPAVFQITTPKDVAGNSGSAASQGPGFLFVECNGQDGRIETRVRPLVNRHVMLNHVYQETADVNDDEPGRVDRTDSAPALKKKARLHLPSPPAQLREFEFVATQGVCNRRPKTQGHSQVQKSNASRKRTTIDVATPSRRLPYPSPPLSPDPAAANVCYWWFEARSDLRPSFNVAKTHWVESAWTLARRSPAVYECVALFAARKKAMVTGEWSDYLVQEVRCIRSMSGEVQKRVAGPRPLLPVAIGVLAYLALLDHRVDIAITHLHAIRSLWSPLSFEDTRTEWVYVVWLDLRFALHLGRAPILEYYISAPFRSQTLPNMPFDLDQVSRDMAEQCASLSPQSEILQSTRSIRLFQGIFELYFAWPALEKAEQTPFGRIYDLDYWLCLLRSHILPISTEGPLTTAMAVELILATMQIHVWIVTRFWAPIGAASRELLLSRTFRLITSSPASAFIEEWKTHANLASLLWILSTITACGIEAGLDSTFVPLVLLRLTTEAMDIQDIEKFITSLKEWPWIDNWHQVKLNKLWELLIAETPIDVAAGLAGLRISDRPTILGGLEFYNE